MSVLGIVLVKKTSKRLVNKNQRLYRGKPLFWHSVVPMLNCSKVDKIVVATDSDFIRQYAEQNRVTTVWRAENAARGDTPLFDILKYVYFSMSTPYHIVLSIMANCPGHTVKEIDQAISLMETSSQLREIRSFDKSGIENGLLLLRSEVLHTNPLISVYMGAVVSRAKEVHVEKDLIDEID